MDGIPINVSPKTSEGTQKLAPEEPTESAELSATRLAGRPKRSLASGKIGPKKRNGSQRIKEIKGLSTGKCKKRL
jgi:hypothetical protein